MSEVTYIPKPVSAEQMIHAMSRVRTRFADKLEGELKLSTDTLTSYTIEARTKGAYELYEMLLGEIGKLINS